MTTDKRPVKHPQKKSSLPGSATQPFVDHLQELKHRLLIVAAVVVSGIIIAFWFEQQLIQLLLRPSNGQHFIYTSPLGGINFIFSFSLYVGLILATPVTIYQLIAFVQPIMKWQSSRFTIYCSLLSTAAAALGIGVGYAVGLPNTLNALLHQFNNQQIQPLLTIQSYISFVALYLLGSVLIFQLPLVMIIANRIVTITPARLIKYERHVFVAALIVSFIMNPTPNIVSQLIVAVPIVLMYNLGVVIIWWINGRQSQPATI